MAATVQRPAGVLAGITTEPRDVENTEGTRERNGSRMTVCRELFCFRAMETCALGGTARGAARELPMKVHRIVVTEDFGGRCGAFFNGVIHADGFGVHEGISGGTDDADFIDGSVAKNADFQGGGHTVGDTGFDVAVLSVDELDDFPPFIVDFCVVGVDEGRVVIAPGIEVCF